MKEIFLYKNVLYVLILNISTHFINLPLWYRGKMLGFGPADGWFEISCLLYTFYIFFANFYIFGGSQATQGFESGWKWTLDLVLPRS